MLKHNLRSGISSRRRGDACPLFRDGFSLPVSTADLRCARPAGPRRVHQMHQPRDDVHRYANVYCSFVPNNPWRKRSNTLKKMVLFSRGAPAHNGQAAILNNDPLNCWFSPPGSIQELHFVDEPQRRESRISRESASSRRRSLKKCGTRMEHRNTRTQQLSGSLKNRHVITPIERPCNGHQV